MAKRAGSAVFSIARADASVLLGDLDRNEPSPLYAYLVKQLTIAGQSHPPMDFLIAEDHVEPFRQWLDRAKARHTRNGHWETAQAFARVRRSER
jgi:hypothetical protein